MDLIILYFVLYLLAMVCFVLATFSVHTPRVNLLAVGLALWTAVPLIQTLQKL